MYGGGAYQRTKDGKTIVWNNNPKPGDEVTWSGKRDSNGYAVGLGTLTWYDGNPTAVTGSNIPFRRRTFLISRNTGNMVEGKFDGPVVSVDDRGKIYQLTFVNGKRVIDRKTAPAPAADKARMARVERSPSPKPPAEGPSPSAAQKPNKSSSGGVVVEAPTRSEAPSKKAVESSSPPMVVAMAAPRPTVSPPPEEIDPAVKARLDELKQQTESVLSQVADANGNFPQIDRLDSVRELPPTVSKSIGSLVNTTRDIQTKLGAEATLPEYRTETETADALSVVDQIAHDIATSDAPGASAKVNEFLNNHSEPEADRQKAVWGYLNSIRALCSQLEKEAETHLQRAQSFAAASKTSEAIREYQEAYRIFPNPATAAKIRQLQDNSLGL
jgi:hypothetical protein